MGKQVARTKIDQIDKIEQSLSLEISKQTKSHCVLVPVIISIALIAIPAFLYYRYADPIKNYLEDIFRKEDGTSEQINVIEEEAIIENAQIVEYFETEDELEEEPDQEKNEPESSSETETSTDDIELTK